jgi:hypothetical protein
MWIKTKFDLIVNVRSVSYIHRGLSVTTDDKNNLVYENGNCIYVKTDNYGSSNPFEIGVYKDEERALEVFKDLQEWLGIETYRKRAIELLHETDFKLDDMKQALKTYSEVYVMPEE